MELSIDAGLISREASEAFSRISPKLEEAEEAFDKIEVSGPAPRRLMVTLLSELIAYRREMRMKNNVYQVAVGFVKGDGPTHPNDQQALDIVPNDQELLDIIANRVAEAVETCPLEEEDRVKFREVVAEWRDSLHT